ncbi:hypothetical protein [Mycolicibacterium fallax]|uniref:hypothetical protein n=1 Tax=Mycolicibacterium fallax TaxID=1793 RepID=UPI0010569283|nr:hypothetical protein [Mycolicibacterium fallax]BBY98320.1 hypothetical protein MFAL_17870 [Mycolicibacterium fallax]HSA39413.1 hypothetical protein [Mycobacterium sp.]
MADEFVHRDEILGFLRRANCHYGNTVRDQEEGLSEKEAALKRKVQPDRISELRGEVRHVVDGRLSNGSRQADYEQAVLRALLHFPAELSGGLRQYIDSRLARIKAEHRPNQLFEPLRCDGRSRRPSKQPEARNVCAQCHQEHAGECW